MGCRRKTKTERELVADINKAFLKFCYGKRCADCKFGNSYDCKLEYIKELLDLDDEEDNDEC